MTWTVSLSCSRSRVRSPCWRTPMERFERQMRIAGWNQQRLQEACVAVCGRDWLGTFTVWALAALGIGDLIWLEPPCQASATLSTWFLADPCPFSGCTITAYPFQVEYWPELPWALGPRRLDVLACCNEDPGMRTVCRTFAHEH